LQQVALVTDLDRHDPDGDAVTLMTLHNAKGLEFPSVFISGLEEGLFPLARAYEEPAQLEEERRLFYVGITRAEDRLAMTWARTRRRAGGFMTGHLSSFVEAIPTELLERAVSTRLQREAAAYRGYDGRGRREPIDDFASAGRAAVRRVSQDRSSEDQDRSADDQAFEEGLNQDLPHLVPGERVSHGTFGSGRVVEVTGFGGDVKVTVDFESVGRKRLLARYAALEKDF
ncbi:MAG: 3'-5' exonuclease, partial [Gemmatimonadota bacterium]